MRSHWFFPEGSGPDAHELLGESREEHSPDEPESRQSQANHEYAYHMIHILGTVVSYTICTLPCAPVTATALLESSTTMESSVASSENADRPAEGSHKLVLDVPDNKQNPSSQLIHLGKFLSYQFQRH